MEWLAFAAGGMILTAFFFWMMLKALGSMLSDVIMYIVESLFRLF